MVVKEFEGLPSVVDGFFAGDRALRPGNPEGGWWVVCVCVEVKSLEGDCVLVDVGEGVGWQLVVWCVCWVDVGIVEAEVVLKPFVVSRGPRVWCPGWVWCVKVLCSRVGVR